MRFVPQQEEPPSPQSLAFWSGTKRHVDAVVMPNHARGLEQCAWHPDADVLLRLDPGAVDASLVRCPLALASVLTPVALVLEARRRRMPEPAAHNRGVPSCLGFKLGTKIRGDNELLRTEDALLGSGTSARSADEGSYVGRLRVCRQRVAARRRRRRRHCEKTPRASGLSSFNTPTRSERHPLQPPWTRSLITPRSCLSALLGAPTATTVSTPP